MRQRRRTERTGKRRRVVLSRLLRRYAVLLTLAGTLAVILLGLFLPSAILRRQRRAAEGAVVLDMGEGLDEVENTSFEGRPLVFEALADMIDARYETSERFHEPMEGEMTESEAIAQAGKELARMAEDGLIPKTAASLEGAQYTAILSSHVYEDTESASFDPAYDVWNISFYKKDSAIRLLLHASSGKITMVSINYSSESLRRLWELENAIYDVAEYDMQTDSADSEAYGLLAVDVKEERPRVQSVRLSGRTAEDVVFESVKDEDIASHEWAELAATVFDENGDEIERVVLTDDLTLAQFVDGFYLRSAWYGFVEYLGFRDLYTEIWDEPEPDAVYGAVVDERGRDVTASLTCYWDDYAFYLNYEIY